MNFGKQSREKSRKKNESQRRNTKMPSVKAGNQCQQGKHWRGYSMCREPAASGRHCPGSTEAAVQYTEGFRNGWQLVSLKKSGVRVWSSAMSWKGSAGNGKVWTAVWSPLGRIQRTEEKMGTKRSVLTDEKGLPLAIVISGANTHDIKLLDCWRKLWITL